MAVYNAEAFLDQAIQSVIAQDHSNWELLIVNDGSTDNSLSIAKAQSDNRIKIFNQPNRGVSNARNSALKFMKGDFFCFLDADDVFTPNSLSLRLNCFTEDYIWFADGSVDVFDSGMNTKIQTWIPEQPENLIASLLRLDGKCFFGPTWMVRRNPLVTYKFDEELTHGEDLFFYMSYAHMGGYSFTRQVILKYRKSSHSAMNNLAGLANGYSLIKHKIKHLSSAVSKVDSVIFDFKSRKIIFLSLISVGKISLALNYLFRRSL